MKEARTGVRHGRIRLKIGRRAGSRVVDSRLGRPTAGGECEDGSHTFGMLPFRQAY
jgi:hypothetical protein